MGDFPMMTDRGTFIIHGTERVVVTQLVRSPGAYIMEPKQAEREKQVLVANLMPQRGSWLELEIDKKGAVNVRIDRKRKFPVTVLLRAMGYGANDELLALFDDSVYIRNTIERDTTGSQEEALVELFRKQRPGEPPTLDGATAMLKGLFFDPKRYDLSRVGRHKLNVRLHGHIKPEDRADADVRVLVNEDIIELIRRLIALPGKLGVPDDAKDYAAEANSLLATRREEIAHEIDEYEHFGNRRLRTVGELVQDAFRIGLARMERVIRERLTTEDPDTIVPATLVNIRPVVAALKEFFGSSQLSQFMDQTNSLSGLTHRRRLSALGAGGLTRERAPIEVRDVHPTHYGRMCPIETPEGPNIGLIGSLASMATVDEFGFIRSPYRKVLKGKVTGEIVYLDASEEEAEIIDPKTKEIRYVTIAQANAPFDPKTGEFKEELVLARTRAGAEIVQVPPARIDYMDVSPSQLVSVATALIPFLEHDDANRALMGSNMQRQAVPLLTTEAPFVGTGMEFRAAVDTGDVVLALRGGKVSYVDADSIEVDAGKGEVDSYPLVKFMRSNQGTLIHQKPLVFVGDKVQKGDVLCDGSSTDHGELALGRNLLVAFMSWEGFNFEDAIIISERVVKEDMLSSIHIEEYEVDARTTKLGDEEITRDIPNRSEESLKDLDERGIVRIGAEVNSGDLLVGKVTPKGETELTAEEKLIRAIFKEKAREVRDTSLKVPHGEGGKVIDVKIFSRENNDELPPSVNELVRVYVAKKRKIAEGDKLAGRHGNKGVISKIVPEEDMPHLEDGMPVDIILNPLGVPSRMNIGQVLETHLGWAAHLGFQADGERSNQPTRLASPVFDGATLEEIDDLLIRSTTEDADSPVQFKINEKEPARSPLLRQGVAVRRPHRGAFRQQGDHRLHVHPEAAASRGRQDPRPQHGPVLARHAAAAGRQGAVRRPALRRDGGLGSGGVRRRLRAAGDAHDQVRRHGRPRQGVRGHRQGREHRQAQHPRVVQGPHEGDPEPGSRHVGPERGGRRPRGARGGRRPAARRRGARHRPHRQPASPAGRRERARAGGCRQFGAAGRDRRRQRPARGRGRSRPRPSDLLAAVVTAAHDDEEEDVLVAAVSDDDVPDLDGLGDILDFDAPDLESDEDDDTDED